MIGLIIAAILFLPNPPPIAYLLDVSTAQQ